MELSLACLFVCERMRALSRSNRIQGCADTCRKRNSFRINVYCVYKCRRTYRITSLSEPTTRWIYENYATIERDLRFSVGLYAYYLSLLSLSTCLTVPLSQFCDSIFFLRTYSIDFVSNFSYNFFITLDKQTFTGKYEINTDSDFSLTFH